MDTYKYISKLKEIVKSKINDKEYEEALKSARTLADIYYNYNQIYTDTELENSLLIIQDAILKKQKYAANTSCVFFYDGFGLDLRGWAASFVRALISLGYYVIYSCPISEKGKIPHIEAELNCGKFKIIYFDNKSEFISRTKEINAIFADYKPCTAFFYTTPHDVCAAIAFSNNESTNRIQIDLTDHAYWIGVNALDYTMESREMAASLAIYERNIDSSKILKLDCAPYINKDKLNESYPFDIYKEKYIFTGGALYKTFGDKELLYYKTVDYILEKYNEIKFLYAGSGDDSELHKLKNKYKDRVFHINERPDFFEIMKNCIIYLNSYPMFGGLMMRYAALAHKVPITLKHEHDADGILINQDKLGIEFDDYQEYLDEINKLLCDDEYRKFKENVVSDSVINEDVFAKNVDLMIKEHRTMYSFEKIDKLDTSKFRDEYKKRYTYLSLCKSIAKKDNKFLIPYFPCEYFYGAIEKIKEKLRND